MNGESGQLDIEWSNLIDYITEEKYGSKLFEKYSKSSDYKGITLSDFFEPIQFYLQKDIELNYGSRLTLLFIEAFIERYRQYEIMFADDPTKLDFMIEKLVLTLVGRKLVLPMYGWIHENTVVQIFAKKFKDVLSTTTHHSERLNFENEKGTVNLMKHHEAVTLSFERYTVVMRQVCYYISSILYLIVKQAPLEDVLRIIALTSISSSYCLLNSAKNNNIKTTVAKKANAMIQSSFSALYADFENLSENGELHELYRTTMVHVRELVEVRINSVTLMDNNTADTLIAKDILMALMMKLKPDTRYTVIMEQMNKTTIDLADVLARLHLDFNVIKTKFDKSMDHNECAIIGASVKERESVEKINERFSKYKVFAEMCNCSVKKSVSGDVLLKPTCLKIKRGYWYFLSGKSGSGKSLIFISALMRGMYSENIEYNGEFQYFDGTEKKLTYVDLVPYITHIHLTKAIVQSFTVKQNYMLGVEICEDVLDEICRLKKLFDIEHIDDDAPVSSCSTGEQQRIQLVRVIIQDHPVWILDEATTNIDSETAATCVKELRRIQRERGKIVIEINHYHNHKFFDYKLNFNDKEIEVTSNNVITSYYSNAPVC